MMFPRSRLDGAVMTGPTSCRNRRMGFREYILFAGENLFMRDRLKTGMPARSTCPRLGSRWRVPTVRALPGMLVFPGSGLATSVGVRLAGPFPRWLQKYDTRRAKNAPLKDYLYARDRRHRAHERARLGGKD